MTGEPHHIGTDLVKVDKEPWFIRALVAENLSRLERLLAAHAGFDKYLREREA